MQIAQTDYLAKLLATEDVSVRYDNVPTAMFDLKTRTIILPNWKECSPALRDLLVGHEIGHALETPPEGWHDAICDQGKGFKSFLNICEDARIETAVKTKYPGIVRSFYAGYKELLAKDFFGIAGRDLQELPLIDRINLHTKCGSLLGIQFSEEEQALVDRVTNTNSWDDVMNIASELYEYSKTEESMIEEQQDLSFGEGDDFEFEESDDYSESNSTPSQSGESEEEEDQESDSSGQNDESEEETQEENSSASNEETEEEAEEEKSESKTETGGDINEGSDAECDPEAMTDTNFRNNEESLVNNDVKYIETVKWMKSKKDDVYVMPVSKTWDFEFEFRKGVALGSYTTVTKATAESMLWNEFNQKNKTYINLLAQQFEMKRKASVLAKAKQYKTGKLNEDKLWAYKLTEDLFLANTVIPDGKNHGLFMMIDMSGSMHNQMGATIEQLLVQVAFCKKVNIPFKVYGFSGNGPKSSEVYDKMAANIDFSEGNLFIANSHFCLIELISSELSGKDYTQTFKKLLSWKLAYTYHNYYEDSELYLERYDIPGHLQLSQTPLAPAVMVARNLAIKFQRDNRVEVLNTIILTDGGNTDELDIASGNNFADGEFRPYKTKRIEYRWDELHIKEGPVLTKFSTEENNGRHHQSMWYKAALKHYKVTTGSRMISFYICDNKKREVELAYSEATASWWNEEFDAKYKGFRKNNFLEIENAGSFDSVFIIKGGRDLEVDDAELEVASAKKSDLLRGFKKFNKNKSNSRAFLTAFIEKVA